MSDARPAPTVSIPARSRAVRGALLAAALTLLVSSPAALAGGLMRPHSIRANRVEPVARPGTTIQFDCEVDSFTDGFPCYGPEAIRKAYRVNELLARGYTGKGQTIVIIDAFGSPTLKEDLDAFDAVFGLPAPPSLRQIHMPGSQPFDNHDNNQLGWAGETSLDVQWAHAIAPGANIVVVASANNDDLVMLDAQNYAIDHNLGFILSESFDDSEYALLHSGPEGKQTLSDYEKSYRRARRQQISVLVASGDTGAAGFDVNGNLVAFPVAEYPASSPNITSVGGTSLFFGSPTNADPDGSYQGEIVWNDGFGAGGGGLSQRFETPNFQKDGLTNAARKSLHGFRGYPDVAYNAGVFGGVIVHLGFFDPAIGFNGFYIFGGTSAGAPQWAGITALGNQLAGRPLGFLNKRLYGLGAEGALFGLMHDVTLGDDSFFGIPGFSAKSGWDLTTGWGTPNFGLRLSLLSSMGDDDGMSDP